jgi:hypothetical protein
MTDRDTSAPSTTRLRLEAYTDWLVVVAATVLTALRIMPWEAWAVVCGGVAGVAGVMKGRGKSGGALFAMGAPIAKALAAFLGGTGGRFS